MSVNESQVQCSFWGNYNELCEVIELAEQGKVKHTVRSFPLDAINEALKLLSRCATKAAVRSFARSWTVDLKHRKIRVNAISPGPIDTPMTRSMVQGESGEQLKKNLLSTMPLGRMGNPDEIAKAVSFLASDDSSFVTGIELFVDGGQAQI
jgi:NAD(P)-dependent dehydrogenase (short-subunit alcohol dehydrogenase family)